MGESLAVIVVTWNSQFLIGDCLESVEPQLRPGDQLLVVDNASADDTESVVRDVYPRALWLQMGGNLGYGRAVNRGLVATAGEWALVLNPDVRLLPGALEAMRRMLERDPAVAVVGPRLLGPDGRPQLALRRYPTIGSLVLEGTPAERIPGLRRVPRRFRMEDQSASHARTVDWIWGACMLLRREALAQTGGFDPTFFMYSEEVDLCRRLGSAGWQAVYEPAAVVVHQHGASSAQVPAATLSRYNRSKVLYAKKVMGGLMAELLRRSLLGVIGGRRWMEKGKLLLGHRPDLRCRRIRAYEEVLASGLRREL